MAHDKTLIKIIKKPKKGQKRAKIDVFGQKWSKSAKKDPSNVLVKGLFGHFSVTMEQNSPIDDGKRVGSDRFGGGGGGVGGGGGGAFREPF